MSQTNAAPRADGVAVLAEGLLVLTRAERLELDAAVTPRVAALMAKAFGPEFYELMRPLTRDDGPDGKPRAAMPDTSLPGATPRVDRDPLAAPHAGRAPDEEALRRMMRDPRYWRDKDPAILDRVSEGFRRLYG
ncbi:hypothetical protein KAJ83_15650 [Marivibrio halodurans]|uniref:Uncharacterized protein n=1 Tax=Marivibrio halodurans TaxID=2039722 RepID=A0A8J7S1C3_9PROT|nr:hypothetical protein [Marivibrio halodurans]MBP5858455.1 hypothetical protein [Marivibrio halodurans]